MARNQDHINQSCYYQRSTIKNNSLLHTLDGSWYLGVSQSVGARAIFPAVPNTRMKIIYMILSLTISIHYTINNLIPFCKGIGCSRLTQSIWSTEPKVEVRTFRYFVGLNHEWPFVKTISKLIMNKSTKRCNKQFSQKQHKIHIIKSLPNT